MRRPARHPFFPRLFASLLTFSLVSPVFARDDDWNNRGFRPTSYSTNYNRPQNFGATDTRMFRQMSTVDGMLRFQKNPWTPPTGGTGNLSLKGTTPSFKPLPTPINFNIKLNDNPRMTQNIKIAPVMATTKPGPVAWAVNAIKTVGAAIGNFAVKIGSAIGNFVRNVVSPPKTYNPATDKVVQNFPSVQRVAPNTYEVQGGPTKVAMVGGKAFHEGSTFNASGGKLNLIQGTAMEPNFGPIQRTDGGFVPVKYTGDGKGGINATGIDFSRMKAGTGLEITSPIDVGGLGQIQPGKMNFEGMKTSGSENGASSGAASFKMTGMNVHVDKKLSDTLSLKGLATMKTAEVTLKNSMMSLKSATIQTGEGAGARKIYLSEKRAPMEVTSFGKKAETISSTAKSLTSRATKASNDVEQHTLAAGALISNLSKQTGGNGVQLKTGGNAKALTGEAQSFYQTSTSLTNSVAVEDWSAAVDNIESLESQQKNLSTKVEQAETQAQAVKTLQQSLSGMTRTVQELAPKIDTERMSSEKPLSERELNERGRIFSEPKALIALQSQTALDSLKAMVMSGNMPPDSATELGAKVMATRNRLIASMPKDRSIDSLGELGDKLNAGYDTGKKLVDLGADAAFFGWMGRYAEKHPTAGLVVGTVGLAGAKTADTINKAVGVVALIYFGATAFVTTGLTVGTVVLAEKSLEAIGVKEEAASAYAAAGGIVAGGRLQQSGTLRAMDESIATTLGNKIMNVGRAIAQLREGGTLSELWNAMAETATNNSGKIRLPSNGGGKSEAVFDEKAGRYRDTESGQFASRPEWTKFRRPGLPIRTPEESLVKGQLTDREWTLLREKAVRFRKDIVLSGGRSETDLGFSRRYALENVPDSLRLQEAEKLGIPAWRAEKFRSDMVDFGTGDVDIWTGSKLTPKERDIIMREVFPNLKMRNIDSGYSQTRYQTLEHFGSNYDGPGAIVFRADGRIERIKARWQME